jgi:hypothetical protein
MAAPGSDHARPGAPGAAEPVAAYREHYRSEHIPARYSGPLHLAFTSLGSLAVIVICVAALDGVTPWEWLTVPATFLYANLAEYLGHRGPMHHPFRGLRMIFVRHACQHHRFFTDRAMQFDSSRDYRAVLFPPVLMVFFLTAFALPAWLLLLWLFSPNVAYLFVATAIAYFLNYELLHFAYHARPDSLSARLPGMAALRRLHTRHHDPALMQRCNFNITYPLGDLLFGTLYRSASLGGVHRDA